jgi:hypothetical protein
MSTLDANIVNISLPTNPQSFGRVEIIFSWTKGKHSLGPAQEGLSSR